MRTKHPPGRRLGVMIGLCAACAALSACAASDAGSPVAGSAAPIATPAPDAGRAPDPDPDAGPVADPERIAAGDVSGRLDTRGSSSVDTGRGDVAQQVAGSDAATGGATPPSGGASDASASGRGDDDPTPSRDAHDSGATTATTAATTTATTDAPGRTSNGGHSGRPGTPPTTAANRRPGTTSVVTTSTVAPESPAPPTTDPLAPPPSPTTEPPPREPANPPASDAVTLVNAIRTAAGLSALVEIEALHAAAQAHSLDQASMQSMTHIGSDGADAGARVARSGFVASVWAEHLATGYGSADAAIQGWMSPGGQDRANMLDPGFTAVGLASAEAGDGTVYWTMLLAG